jgi:hypothetical protein
MKNARLWHKTFALAVTIELVAIVGAAVFRSWNTNPHDPRRLVFLAFCFLTAFNTLALVVLFAIYGVLSVRREDPMLRLAKYLSAGPNPAGKDYPGITVIPDYSPPADGAGLYRIQGVNRDTRQDTTVEIQADSAANAKVKAELDGIVVTSVVRTADRQTDTLDETIDHTS